MKMKKWRGADINQIFKEAIVKLRSEEENRFQGKRIACAKFPWL